jgi:glycosyltransferase involved in cell wall biosynthesis
MNNKKRIVIIFHSTSIGGAERAMCNIAEIYREQKINTSIIVLCNSTSKKIEVPPHIPIYYLNSSRALFALPKLIMHILRLKPSVVISSIIHVNIYMSLLKLFVPFNIKIISRHTSTFAPKGVQEGFKVRLFYSLARIFYPKIDTIVCQSNFMREEISYFFKTQKNLVVIENFVNTNSIILQLNKPIYRKRTDKIRLLAMGRLEKIKRFDLLIEIFHLLNDDSFELLIIGEGSEKNYLSSLIEKYDLNDVYIFPFTMNPYSEYVQADATVFTSLTDSYPNVAIESLILGTPVIGFNCPGGLSEIVNNSKLGELVTNNDARALINSFKRLKERPYNRMEIKEIAFNRFDISKIKNKWLELI